MIGWLIRIFIQVRYFIWEPFICARQETTGNNMNEQIGIFRKREQKWGKRRLSIDASGFYGAHLDEMARRQARERQRPNNNDNADANAIYSLVSRRWWRPHVWNGKLKGKWTAHKLSPKAVSCKSVVFEPHCARATPKRFRSKSDDQNGRAEKRRT